MIYRRRKTRDTWHHHPACRWWPKPPTEFIERETKPSGEKCNECRSKAKRGVPE